MSDELSAVQRETALAILPLLHYKRRLIDTLIGCITELNRIDAASQLAEAIAETFVSRVGETESP